MGFESTTDEPGRLMLATVRVARGITQDELAKATGISQAVLSKAETGAIRLDDEKIALLGSELAVPPSLVRLRVPVLSSTTHVFHRKRSSSPVSKVNQLRAQIELAHLHVAGILNGGGPEVRLPREQIPDDGYDSPEDISRRVRRRLDLGEGPALSLVPTLERAGVAVLTRTLGSTKIDALVSWPDDQRPLVLLGSDSPADRQRFSLAHELGHAVMHQVPTEHQESEADRFAAELLMPASTIRSQLSDLSIAKLAKLKATWGVSMSALLRRGRDLGSVSDTQYKSLSIELSRAGYRTSEPVQVARERPQLIREAISHRIEAGESTAEIAACAHLTVEEFTHLYMGGIQ